MSKVTPNSQEITTTAGAIRGLIIVSFVAGCIVMGFLWSWLG